MSSNLSSHLTTSSPWPVSHPHHDKISTGKVTEKILTENLKVFCTTHFELEPITVTFETICTSLNTTLLTLDFDGTVNMSVVPSDAFLERSYGRQSSQSEKENKESNVAAVPTGETNKKIIAMFRPNRRTYLGYIQVTDPYQTSSWKTKYSWRMENLNRDDLEVYIKQSRDLLNKQIQQLRDKKITIYTLEQDPMSEHTKKTLNAQRLQFVDLDFLPDEQALYKRKIESDSFGLMQEGSSEKKMDEEFDRPLVQWKRPSHFMSDMGNLKVFLGSISAHDIKQGQLGDCWLLSALAALTEFPELIKDLFLDDFCRDGKTTGNSPVGLYHLRFFKHGMETTIRIDDYFPCLPGPMGDAKYGPIYSRSNGSELWVLLVEKAFAKIHGSYEAIRSGRTEEALMDLTGAPSKTIVLSDEIIKPMVESGELWKLLVAYDEERYLLTAATPGRDIDTEKDIAERCKSSGLIAGHAYTLMACLEVNGVKLCRLRNPWGQREWEGDWSDKSPLWTDEMKLALQEKLTTLNSDQRTTLSNTSGITSTTNYQEICSVENKDDGLFWMCYEDFVKYFHSVSVCMVRHPRYSRQPWQVIRKPFFFDLDPVVSTTVTASNEFATYLGKSNNPKHTVFHRLFKLHVNVPKADFVFTIHQQDTRCVDTKPYIDIAIAVLKANPYRFGKFEFVTGAGLSVERHNQTEVVTLEAGEYVIVPLTTGSQLLYQSINSSNVSSVQSTPVSRIDSMDDTVASSTISSPSTAVLSTTGVVGEIAKRLLDVPIVECRSISSSSGIKEISLSKHVINAYKELFHHLDIDGDGFLDKYEIDNYMVRTTGQGLEEDGYNWLINTFEPPKNRNKKVLSMPGFIAAQLHIFRHEGCDEDRLAQELIAMGFDRKLRYKLGRSMTLSVHCTTGSATPGPVHVPSSLLSAPSTPAKSSITTPTPKGIASKVTTPAGRSPVPKLSTVASTPAPVATPSSFTLEFLQHDQAIVNEAHTMLIATLGETVPYENGKIKVYTYRAGYTGVSFMVENCYNFPLDFTLDCTKSTNVLSHRDSLIHNETVLPGERVIFHHLTVKDGSKTWSWTHSSWYLWSN